MTHVFHRHSRATYPLAVAGDPCCMVTIGEQERATRKREEQAAREAAQARQAAATALVMRELLLQEARSHGIDTADTDTAIATLIERAVQLPQADAATCRQVFDANPKAFRTPDLYEVAHILFAAAPGIPEDRAAAKSAAETTIADLVTDPSRFAGYVKANMPQGATWENPSLTDEEAWDVAAYVNAHERPQDPRLVNGDIDETRKRYHADDGVNLYGVMVDGRKLGQGVK